MISGEKQSMLREKLINKLAVHNIRPSERIGQNFLIDEVVLQQIATLTPYGGTVLEIGSGPGQLTEVLAGRANKVVGIELDSRFKPILDEVSQAHDNISIVYGDAIALPWKKILPKREVDDSLHLVANIPYHITEPLMGKLIQEPIEAAVLMVGKKFAETIAAESENDTAFSKLTLLAQTFFTVGFEGEIDRESFYPIPGTQSELITLTPKSKEELLESRKAQIFRRLFLTADRNPSVVSVLKNALVEFGETSAKRSSVTEVNKYQRRDFRRSLRSLVGGYNSKGQEVSSLEKGSNDRDSLLKEQHRAMRVISSFKLPSGVLDRPFNMLSNSDLRALSKALGD